MKADCSVNSHVSYRKFCELCVHSMFCLYRLCTQYVVFVHGVYTVVCTSHLVAVVKILIKYCIVQKLDHLTCSKFLILTALYKPNNFISADSQSCINMI